MRKISVVLGIILSLVISGALFAAPQHQPECRYNIKGNVWVGQCHNLN